MFLLEKYDFSFYIFIYYWLPIPCLSNLNHLSWYKQGPDNAYVALSGLTCRAPSNPLCCPKMSFHCAFIVFCRFLLPVQLPMHCFVVSRHAELIVWPLRVPLGSALLKHLHFSDFDCAFQFSPLWICSPWFPLSALVFSVSNRLHFHFSSSFLFFVFSLVWHVWWFFTFYAQKQTKKVRAFCS